MCQDIAKKGHNLISGVPERVALSIEERKKLLGILALIQKMIEVLVEAEEREYRGPLPENVVLFKPKPSSF